MKKLLAIILCIALITCLFAGCSATTSSDSGSSAVSNDNGSSSEGDTSSDSSQQIVFTAATTTQNGSLYPFGINHGTKQAIRGAIYEPLFWLDYEGELHGILAKSYETSGDGVYDIELFDYIEDSAGNHMTASDVIYSIDLWIADGKGNNNYGTLTSYEQTGEYSIRLTFENEQVGAFEKCVTYCYCITQAAWEASPDEMYSDPVGTGRYEMTDFVEDSYYTMTKRDSYWQTDESYICDKNAARVDVFTVKIVADATTLAVALETGEIDYATKEIQDADRVNFMDEDGNALDGYSAEIYPTTANAHITFNCNSNSPCSDINLRKAICYAIDAAAIAYNVQGVYGYVGTSCLVPSVLDADESLNAHDDYYSYNLELAKEYLEKSSYSGETLTMLVKPNEWTWQSAILIQAYCNAIGIDVYLDEPETALYNEARLDETGTKYDMDLAGMSASDGYAWKALIDLDSSSSTTGVSRIMTVDTTLDELFLNAAMKATSSVETVNELVQYVDEQCYFYNIFYYPYVFTGNDRVVNQVIDANLECIFTAFTVTP